MAELTVAVCVVMLSTWQATYVLKRLYFKSWWLGRTSWNDHYRVGH